MHRRLVGTRGPLMAAKAGEITSRVEADVTVADELVHEWVDVGVHGDAPV